MADSESVEKSNGEDITKIVAQIEFAISSGRKKPKEIDLSEYISKLHDKIRSGSLNEEIIRALSIISKILETKIDILLNELLGKQVSLKDIALLLDVSALLKQNEIESLLADILSVLHPLGTLYLPIQEQEIIEAYLGLTAKTHPAKYGSSSRTERLEIDLVNFEPKSIEADKKDLFEQLRKYDLDTIPFSRILSKYPSWREVLNKLTVLTYLAHEDSIAMWQKDYDSEIFLKPKKLPKNRKRLEDESS